MAAQIVSGLQGLPLDDAKLYKLTTDSGLDVSETKAAVAALEHIMACAARSLYFLILTFEISNA
jgi:hypothetical protein